jgi:hypothetical protein
VSADRRAISTAAGRPCALPVRGCTSGAMAARADVFRQKWTPPANAMARAARMSQNRGFATGGSHLVRYGNQNECSRVPDLRVPSLALCVHSHGCVCCLRSAQPKPFRSGWARTAPLPEHRLFMDIESAN